MPLEEAIGLAPFGLAPMEAGLVSYKPRTDYQLAFESSQDGRGETASWQIRPTIDRPAIKATYLAPFGLAPMEAGRVSYQAVDGLPARR